MGVHLFIFIFFFLLFFLFLFIYLFFFIIIFFCVCSSRNLTTNALYIVHKALSIISSVLVGREGAGRGGRSHGRFTDNLTPQMQALNVLENKTICLTWFYGFVRYCILFYWQINENIFLFSLSLFFCGHETRHAVFFSFSLVVIFVNIF